MISISKIFDFYGIFSGCKIFSNFDNGLSVFTYSCGIAFVALEFVNVTVTFPVMFKSSTPV